MSRPIRYTFILGLTALATTLAALGGWRYARASAPVPGPIILISIDSLRTDHLRVYGYGIGPSSTPSIDSLARDGVVFERAYSHAPQTLPAHAALFSGRLPFETGVRDAPTASVKRGERLLPVMLRERGYATAGVVSSSSLAPETGIAQGFDFYDAEMPPSDIEASDGTERDGAATEAIAEQWLGTVESSRAFLFLHLNEPHAPYRPPARFVDLPPYDGEIAYVDEIVGRLLRYLKSHQLYDQSTIVLLSDHGEGLGDHGEREHGLFVYDETIHVPLIIKQAAAVGAGHRVVDVVQHLDIVPTMLDLVKAPIPGSLRGRSLTAAIEARGDLDPVQVYSEAYYGRSRFGWSAVTALTDRRHRYINAPREELYDLERDPGERENILEFHEDVGDSLRRAVSKLVRLDRGTGVPPVDPKDKREVAEIYRAAMDRAGQHKWPQAIALFERIVKVEPGLPEIWSQLAASAALAERYDQSLDAYQRVLKLEPADRDAELAAASVLLKARRLDEARAAAEALVDSADERDLQADAHLLLSTIALARREPLAAREHAASVEQADPALPAGAYVEGRILFDEGRYGDALPMFEKAAAASAGEHRRILPDLHYYLAETLVRLDRGTEAEEHYERELDAFPQNLRARGGLTMMYVSQGRMEEAAEAVDKLMRVTPTPDGFGLAAKLWTALGHRRQAEAARSESRRLLADHRTPPTRSARR